MNEALSGPSFDRHGWKLESGEERHANAPDSFWIPAREDRETMHFGHGAKLIFAIQIEEGDGSFVVDTERMWVVVTEVVDGGYVGLLDNEPACVDPDSDHYLVRGAEIPFRPEHVIDIDVIPKDALERMSLQPSRIWPRP
jgi:hypothetical protein